MNIHLDSIHLPSLFSGTQSNFFGNLHNHVVTNAQVLSSYIRYNELTLAGTVLGINWGLISLSEKIMLFASPRFQGEFFQKAWVHQPSKFLFKSLVAGAGITVMNRLLELQLNKTLIAASVVSAIIIKHVWEHVISSEIGCLRKSCKTEEQRKNLAGDGALKGKNACRPSKDGKAQPNKIGTSDAERLTSSGELDDEEDLVEDSDHQDHEDQILNDASPKRRSNILKKDPRVDSHSSFDFEQESTESMLATEPLQGALEQIRKFGRKNNR